MSKDKVGDTIRELARGVSGAIALAAERPKNGKELAELFTESCEVSFQAGLVMGARLGEMSPSAAAALVKWWTNVVVIAGATETEREEAVGGFVAGAEALLIVLEPGVRA